MFFYGLDKIGIKTKLNGTFSYPAHEGGEEVVDDVSAKEEGVDEAAILVTKCLRGDGWLCGVGS